MRWIIGDTESGSGETRRVHILVKPTRPDLDTNLVVNTDRRTYLIELRSREKPYMPSVCLVLSARSAHCVRAGMQRRGSDTDHYRRRYLTIALRYAIEGDNPPWRPVSAYDDGSQSLYRIPSGIAQGEMPPLFVIGPDGNGRNRQLSRVRQNYCIVDRLFAAAELRLGGENQQNVRIVRTDGRTREQESRNPTFEPE